MKKPSFACAAKKIVLSFVLMSVLLPCFAQKVYQDRQIRFALWASGDAYPGYFDQTKAAQDQRPEPETMYDVPVARIKEVAPFLLEGMVYGWKFDYVPYDRARRVEEYFSFKPVQSFSETDKANIRYEKPWAQDDRLWCWIAFERTSQMMHRFLLWQGITNPRVKGIGYARLTDGFAGIQAACGEAVKQAVREYERKLIKNKPKEIFGTVLISEPPLIGIDSGRYMVTLDFFLETDRIVKYETF